MKRFFSALMFSCLAFGAGSAAAQEDPELQHECTSWMVFSDLTKNNTNILHKNRDSLSRNVAVILSPADSPRKWIALGKQYTNTGLNASGLAGAMNSGAFPIWNTQVFIPKSCTSSNVSICLA